jgi:hypothetical protein
VELIRLREIDGKITLAKSVNNAESFTERRSRLRLAGLEKKSAEEGLALTETQIAALERKREEQSHRRSPSAS